MKSLFRDSLAVLAMFAIIYLLLEMLVDAIPEPRCYDNWNSITQEQIRCE